MPALRRITEEQVQIVHDWLHAMDMPVSRHLHREYSDGLLVAKLLKKLFPRYVDLHNYQARFSQGSKMVNWQTLNFKVLNRIGLRLSNEQTELLSRGKSGFVERLLFLIMNLTNDHRARATRSNIQTGRQTPSRIDGLTRPMSKHSSVLCRASDVGVRKTEKIGDGAKQIPLKVYEHAINEIRDKVLGLEYMLKERDNDIKMLLQHIKLNGLGGTHRGPKKVVEPESLYEKLLKAGAGKHVNFVL